MAEASVLLKAYGACPQYEVYPQNLIFQEEERKAYYFACRHIML